MFKKILIIFLFFPIAVASADEELSLEDLAKTEAAQFYVSKQYVKSLEAFQSLESEQPENILIKRYIAKLFDILRQREKAVLKLKEIIRFDKNDFISRQLLGDVYMKNGDFLEAVTEYQYVLDNGDDPAIKTYAEARLAEIDAAKSFEGSEPGKIPVKEFIKSEAAKAFMRGRYEDALQGFDAMLSDYPDDLLIHRMKGITLTRLGKPDEAVSVFHDALERDPDNAAIHYYLGNTYLVKGDVEKAKEEFRWVIANDTTEYKVRAEQSMFQSLQYQQYSQRPWKLYVRTGYEFDTNAVYKSNDDSFTQAGDQNSGRYKAMVYSTYKFYEKQRLSFTGDGYYAQNISNDFPFLNTYTWGVGLSGMYAVNLFNRPLYINIRDGFSQTFLKNKVYLWSHIIQPRFIYNFHPKVRTIASYQFQINKYDNDGVIPFLTSRDGLGHVFSFENTFYLTQKNDVYFSLEYVFERHDTEGNNFIRNVHGGSIKLHVPLLLKMEGDIGLTFRDANYLKYGFAPPKRRDDVFTFSTAVTYPILDYLKIIGQYIFEDSRAKNNVFEYTKHIFGVELSYSY